MLLITNIRGAFLQPFFCSRKANSITNSDCVFEDLGIQYALLKHHIVICGLSGYPIFFTLSHKRHNFRKKVFERIMCVMIFSTSFSEKFLILRRTERYDQNVYWSSCEVLFLSDFDETEFFFGGFDKSTQT